MRSQNLSGCLRCGKCCHYLLDGKLKKCKHLVRFRNGKTLCRVYNSRVGMTIDTDSKGRRIVCILRSESPVDYPGCPFNMGKPYFKTSKEEKE